MKDQMMRRSIAFLVVLVILIYTNDSFGQDSVEHRTLFPKGITVAYGLGNYAVCDEYVSQEKYAGTLPYFRIDRSHFHNIYGFRQKLEYRNSSQINNNNISANITEFSFYMDYLYPACKFKLFSIPVFTFIGPTANLFFYLNNPGYMEGSIHLNYSFVLMFSSGFTSEFIIPVKKGLQIENSVSLSLLSLGLRMPELIEPKDKSDDSQSPAKLLSPLSGLNGTVNLGIRYYCCRFLSAKLNYRFHLLSIREWYPVLSSSDNLILALTYHF